MTIAPGFTDDTLRPVGDWHPARFTQSLTGTEEFTTDADRLLPVVAKHWRAPEGRLILDPWQVWIIRHILETYPPDWPVEHLRGQLRFRQVVVSMGRQNGKSVIGAVLALYLLAMHLRGPRVGGFASRDSQAKIVYDRVKYAVENNPALSMLIRATETRGIHLRSGGIYQTFPASEDRAQGEPFTGAIYDELHIGLAALWDAIILGQRSRRNSLLIGITTAGDDDSALLIRLYLDGQAAIDGADERFGFFVWEAPDDTLTEAGVIAANPAVACGRVDLETTMAEAVKMWRAPRDESGVVGRDRVIRYTLNRFVEGSADTWASLTAWNAGAADAVELEGAIVYGLDQTLANDWGTITANVYADGRIFTHLVASFEAPTFDRLLEACKRLARRGPCKFALDAATLKALGKALVEEGLDVVVYGADDMRQAAATAKALIGRRAVIHPGDPLAKLQMGRAKRRVLPEGERVSRTLSTGDVDAVIATVVGVQAAHTDADNGIQLW